ncbi:hypothetical protein AMJ83_00040 [candidate division WOR_3 bacterium SM23_42]|uniref:Uncharacterized protein n=1 Tax=candidate division WOR_3 bacterium SM23_42 TaxID=1703779 RepID=A0A0S8FX02_UNCW3|nr:MAG: hypothetical protein AMJ83_00040 [candidate division WOR_3 bacterium SM23_42]
MKLSFYDIVNALKQLSPKARQDFIEDLQAATSPSYIKSIKEARAEYDKGKVFPHEEAFKERSNKRKKKGKTYIT